MATSIVGTFSRLLDLLTMDGIHGELTCFNEFSMDENLASIDVVCGTSFSMQVTASLIVSICSSLPSAYFWTPTIDSSSEVIFLLSALTTLCQ